MTKKLLICLALVLVLAVPGMTGAAEGVLRQEATANGAPVLVELSPEMGSAHRIFGMEARTQDYGIQPADLSTSAIERLTPALLTDHAKLLRIDPSQVKLRSAETDGQLWFVSYQQAIDGVPVVGTEIGYTIDQSGFIVSLGADAYTEVNVVTRAELDADRAVELAVGEAAIEGADLSEKPVLMLYPQGDGVARLFVHVWRVHLSSTEPIRDQIVFINAETGQTVALQDNLRDSTISGYVSGDYWPEHCYDSTVHANFTTTGIKLYNIMGQLVANVNTDSNGYFSISNLAYAVYIISITLQDSYIQARGSDDDPITSTWSLVPGGAGKNWGATNGTNVRWHADVIHDYFRNTFGYTGMDYQMKGYVDQGAGYNGAANGTDIFFGSQDGEYWARSSDVVYHEYTHNTIYHIYGGWIGSDYYSQGMAMDEGLADYHACTLNNDPIQGESVGVSRNLDNNTYTWSSSAGAHWNGQVIGGACWDTRQAVGASVANTLVLRALQITPHARDFDDFLINMLIADNTYYGGSHLAQIRAAFAAHGISTPALYASISGPSSLSSYQQGTWTVSASGGVPPYTYQWYYRYPIVIPDEEPQDEKASSIAKRPPHGVWLTVGTGSYQLTRSDIEDFELKCVATDLVNTQVTSNIKSVSVN